jgi:hypothetical protein
MNLLEPVGRISLLIYYPTEADALAKTNELAQYGSYNIILTAGFTYWRIASDSTGILHDRIWYMLLVIYL